LVYNKNGQVYKDKASKKFRIGGPVKANESSVYAGLTGVVIEIRTGRDKETGNDADIYVQFVKPEDPAVLEALDRRQEAKDGYAWPKEGMHVYLDEIMLAPEELDVIDGESPIQREYKGRAFTFRMSADIVFNRPVDPDKGDYVSPGGYEMVMNGKTVTFDFCEYEGGRRPGQPKILEFMQKNPDYDTFEDLETLTEDDLKHLEEIKEFFIYLGEDGESEGLEPVKIIGLWFHVIPMNGKSYDIDCRKVLPYVFPKEKG